MLNKDQLPATCYVSQDGGYFYFSAKPDTETDWRLPNDNPTIHFVQSPYDPCMFDMRGAIAARRWLKKEYSHVTLVF